jgi:hypothetical protein
MDIVCDVNTLFSQAGWTGFMVQGSWFRVQGTGSRAQKKGTGKPVVFVFALPVFGRLTSRIS